MNLDNTISRKKATMFSMGFQYSMLAVMIVRGIIIPPLAIKYIDSNLLGAWFASGNILQWLMISEGGAWLYLRQRVAAEFGARDNDSLAASIGTGGLLLIILGCIIASLGYIASPHIPSVMNLVGDSARQLELAFMLASFGFALSLPANIPRAVCHGLQRQVVVNINQLFAEVISLSICIALLMAGYGIMALALVPLIRELIHNGLNWLYLVVVLRRIQIIPRVTAHYLPDMASQMSWTFLKNLSDVAKKNVDAFIVSQIFGNSTVLIVEWTKRLWELLSHIINRTSGAFTSSLAHLYGEGDQGKYVLIIDRLYVVIALGASIMLGVGITFNQAFMDIWVGSEFYAGTIFNSIYGAAFVLATLTFMLYEVLFSAGYIKLPAVSQLVQVTCRVLILLLLAPYIGLLSIAVSLLLVELLGGVGLLSVLWVKALNVPAEVQIRKSMMVGKGFLVATGLYLLWQYLVEPEGWMMLMVSGTCFSMLIVLAMYLVDTQVRQMMKEFISSRSTWWPTKID